jgi:hypothetical protein
MNFPDMRYYKVVSGEAHTIIKDWHAEVRAGYAKINEIAVRYGAEMDKHVMYGTKVEGLKFKAEPDQKLWRPIAKMPFYYRPNKKAKAGKEIAKAMWDIHIPSGTDLAVKLGCNPFFYNCGQHYMTDCGFKKIGENYFVELPFMTPMRQMPGADVIPRAEYFAAIDSTPDA